MQTKVNMRFDSKMISNILESILAESGLDYKIISNQIVVFEKKNSKDESSIGFGTLTGTVIDQATNDPLLFSKVIIKETGIISVTNERGSFNIENIPEGKYDIQISSLGFGIKEIKNIEIKNNQVFQAGVISLHEVAEALSEIKVSPGSFSIMGLTPLAKQTLTSSELKSLTWSEDLTRAVTRLPGVASSDYSSRFTIRGGDANEVLMELDGMELYEPFHQRDFVGGLFSIVDIETIGSIDLLTGGFGAEFGQRQSGVFKMKTKAIADNEHHSSLGISFLNAHFYTDGNFAENRGKYLISARRGVLDWLFKAINLDETIPTYYDAMVKINYKLNNQHALSFHNLYAGDKTAVSDIKPDNYDIYDTRYQNNYTWLTLNSNLSSKLWVRSMIYGGLVKHDREGVFHKRDYVDKGDFSLTDQRDFVFIGAKQDWVWNASERVALKYGFDIRKLKANYNYKHSIKDIRINENEELHVFTRNVDIATNPSGNMLSAYISAKSKLTTHLVGELGFRYDLTTYSADRLLSPRFGLSYALSPRSSIRVAYGHYYQSQFINNLDVNHNNINFDKAKLSKHYVLGFENQLKNGLSFRLEAYFKENSLNNPIYENLRDPWVAYPESSNDVIGLELSNSSSKGIEFFLKYDLGKKLSCWGSYSLAKSVDNIKNIKYNGLLETQLGELPRTLNQSNTIYIDMNYRFNQKWQLSFAWQFYNGQPLTTYEYAWQRLPPENQLGQETAQLLPDGDLHFYPKHHLYRGDKYPGYHKADVRVNRTINLKKGKLITYIQLINIYNQFNLRKFDLGVTGDDELLIPDQNGGYQVTIDNTSWFRFTPVLGVNWEF